MYLKIIPFIFLIVFLITIDDNVTFASTNNNVASNFEKIHHFYNSISSVIWDGKKYIAVNNHKAGIYTSTNGINWDEVALNINGPKYIAFGKNVYTVTGNFTPVGESGMFGLTDGNGDKIIHKGGDKNILEIGSGKFYDLSVATSIDGVKWEMISGKKDDAGVSWAPATKLIWNGSKFILFSSNITYFSGDGIDFKGNHINIKDPYKLAPKGYLYLNTRGQIDGDHVVFDGHSFFTINADYYGSSILKSNDAVNWDIVYFNTKDKMTHNISNPNIIIGNGGYLVTISDNMILQSVDGLSWSQKEYKRSNLVKTISGKKVVPKIYYFDKYYFFQPFESYDYAINSNKIHITKDLDNFADFNIVDDPGQILFMDDKLIITDKNVFDYSALRKLLKFKDVSLKEWYTNNILRLLKQGIIDGNPDNTFQINNAVQVDQFLKMVLTSLGYKINKSDGGYWADPYIEMSKNLNIINESEFTNYESKITRYQMAKILYRAVNKKNSTDLASNSQKISDFNSIPEEFRESVLMVFANGLITGYPDKEFKGNNTLTRAEACAVIVRLLDM